MGAYEKYNITRVTGDVAIKASAGHLWAVYLTDGTEDADIIIYDDPDSANGTELLEVSVLNGTSRLINLRELGGRSAPLGLYANITGANAVALVWWE
jgi:hypothetical protein